MYEHMHATSLPTLLADTLHARYFICMRVILDDFSLKNFFSKILGGSYYIFL